MAIEKTININVNTDKAEKNLDALDDSLKQTQKETAKVNESTSKLGETLDKVTGGAITKFKSFTSGLKSVAVGFRGVGAAIAASGLGLLVVIISSVVSAFKASEEGQNKFAKLMGVIGSVTGNLIDLLSDFGELVISAFENPKKAISDFANLIKENITNRFEGLIELIPQLGKAIGLLFKGQFSEAGAVAANAVGKVALGVDDLTGAIGKAGEALSKFSKEFADDAAKAAQIAEKRAEADRIERSLIVQRAEADRARAELLEKAQDRIRFNTSERIEFLKQASKIEDEITAKEIQAATIRRDALLLENTLSKSNKEALDAEAESKAKVIQLETARLSKQKELTGQISALTQEEQNRADARLRERQAEIEEFQKQSDSLELEKLTEKEKAKTDIIKQGVETRLEQAKREEEERIRLEQAVADAKVSITGQTLDLVGAIAKEGSAVGKGVAVAQATISGIEGVQNAFTTASKSPVTTVFPAYPFVQAGLAGAFSALQIRKILSTNPSKGGGTSSVSGSGGGGGAQAPSFNLVQGTGTNQIAESISSQKEPIKAFVVSSEVTSGQSLDRNIIENASIG